MSRVVILPTFFKAYIFVYFFKKKTIYNNSFILKQTISSKVIKIKCQCFYTKRYLKITLF